MTKAGPEVVGVAVMPAKASITSDTLVAAAAAGGGVVVEAEVAAKGSDEAGVGAPNGSDEAGVGVGGAPNGSDEAGVGGGGAPNGSDVTAPVDELAAKGSELAEAKGSEDAADGVPLPLKGSNPEVDDTELRSGALNTSEPCGAVAPAAKGSLDTAGADVSKLAKDPALLLVVTELTSAPKASNPDAEPAGGAAKGSKLVALVAAAGAAGAPKGSKLEVASEAGAAGTAGAAGAANGSLAGEPPALLEKGSKLLTTALEGRLLGAFAAVFEKLPESLAPDDRRSRTESDVSS